MGYKLGRSPLIICKSPGLMSISLAQLRLSSFYSKQGNGNHLRDSQGKPGQRQFPGYLLQEETRVMWDPKGTGRKRLARMTEISLGSLPGDLIKTHVNHEPRTQRKKTSNFCLLCLYPRYTDRVGNREKDP